MFPILPTFSTPPAPWSPDTRAFVIQNLEQGQRVAGSEREERRKDKVKETELIYAIKSTAIGESQRGK